MVLWSGISVDIKRNMRNRANSWKIDESKQQTNLMTSLALKSTSFLLIMKMVTHTYGNEQRYLLHEGHRKN